MPNGQAGASIAHENDFDQVWRMNAGYVDKILNGANPGDLPIQRLAAFRYAINLKTAKALGLRIPEPILKRAAIVISGNPVPAPECATVAFGNPIPKPPGPGNIFVEAGETEDGPTAGSSLMQSGTTTKFQCCIHPWMRTELRTR